MRSVPRRLVEEAITGATPKSGHPGQPRGSVLGDADLWGNRRLHPSQQLRQYQYGRSSITGYVPNPAYPSASTSKTLVIPLPESVGAPQTQRPKGRHNPSVEMASPTTAEGIRTPPVLQNFLYCQKLADDLP